MRILHVVPSYVPAYRYGGPILSIHALARAQVAQGHHVEAFTTDADGPERLDVPLGTPVDVDGVGVSYFARTAPRRLYHARGFARALRERVASFDLVHLHSVFLWPTLAAARAARRAGVPYVVSPRGMLVRDLVERHGRLRKSAWLRLFERRTLEEAALVHATSELEVTEARRFPWTWPSFTVVPNGVEVPHGPADPDALSLPIHDLAEQPFVLFLGRLSWKKGLEPLVDAMARLDGVRLVLAGPDDEGLAPRLLERAAERGCADRVVAVGTVRGTDKQFLLEHARALALPSRNENFGNVVLEALAHRTPVVCTSGVGAADVVRRTGAGRVVEPDAASLASGLDALVRGAISTTALDRARDEVRRHYSWSRVARDLQAACAHLGPAPLSATA